MNSWKEGHLVTDGAKSDVITMTIHVEVPQKSKSRSTTWSNCTTWAFIQRTSYPTLEILSHSFLVLFYSK